MKTKNLLLTIILKDRSSHPKVFLRKGVLRIYSKFTGEQPCRSAISVKLLCNFIKITLWHGCSPVNVLHISSTPFPNNTSDGCLLRRYKILFAHIKIFIRNFVWCYFEDVVAKSSKRYSSSSSNISHYVNIVEITSTQHYTRIA